MKKLLPFKIRPFNMANFSGGSGYLLPMFALYVMPATYLLNLIVSALLTFLNAKRANKYGWASVDSVKRSLYRKYVPIVAVVAIALSIVSALTDAFGFIYTTGTIWVFLASVLVVLIPFALIFFTVLTSLYVLCARGRAIIDDDTGDIMVKAKSVFGLTFLFLFLFSIVACLIMFVFSDLIDSSGY